MTRERRYSVSEIDRMRKAISDSTACLGWLPGWEPWSDYRPFIRANPPKNLEEIVRTYMLGGVDVEELEEKAKEAITKASKDLLEWQALEEDKKRVKLELEQNESLRKVFT